jgi:cyclophilin family peptidyl-prolyl cis-trans isomerase
MRSSLLESVIVTEFQAAEPYPSLDLTKAKYSINRLSMVDDDDNNNNSIQFFIIYVPSQQLQGQLQTQHIVYKQIMPNTGEETHHSEEVKQNNNNNNNLLPANGRNIQE